MVIYSFYSIYFFTHAKGLWMQTKHFPTDISNISMFQLKCWFDKLNCNKLLRRLHFATQLCLHVIKRTLWHENSNQNAHAHSLIRAVGPHEETLSPWQVKILIVFLACEESARILGKWRFRSDSWHVKILLGFLASEDSDRILGKWRFCSDSWQVKILIGFLASEASDRILGKWRFWSDSWQVKILSGLRERAGWSEYSLS